MMYLTVEVTKTAGAEQAPETEAGLPSVGSTEQTLTHRPQEDDMATKENIRRSNSDNPYYLSAVGIRKVATELIDQMTMTMACRNIPTPYDYELKTDEATVELKQEIEKYIARMQDERLPYEAPDRVIVADDEDEDDEDDGAKEDPLAVSPYAITGEMPPLERIPGWDALSSEKQEQLREHTRNLLDLQKLQLIQNGIQVVPTRKLQ
jgi:hypothetical protein